MWLRPENHAHAHQSQTGSSRAVPRGQLVARIPVARVVGPPPRLLHAELSPLMLEQQAPPRDRLRELLWQNHMSARAPARARARTYAPPHTHMSKWVTNPVATAATTGAPVLIHRIVVLLRVLDARRNVRHGENPAPHPRVPPRVNRGTFAAPTRCVCAHRSPPSPRDTRAPRATHLTQTASSTPYTYVGGRAHAERAREGRVWRDSFA